MEWRSSWTDPFQEYLKPFADLIGDRRTWRTLLETVKGIIASGSVIGERIAAASGELSRSKNGAQRVLRMAKGESTKRSEVDAEDLTARLRQVGVAQVRKSEAEKATLGMGTEKFNAQEHPWHKNTSLGETLRNLMATRHEFLNLIATLLESQVLEVDGPIGTGGS